MRPLLIAVLAATVMTPALAQRRQPTPEQRIDRLERQVRQMQSRVYPRGQPVDTAGLPDDPAATQGAVNALTLRLDAIERQMTEILRSTEENGNRVGVLEADLARLRADQDRRFRALETPGAGAAAAADGASAAQPAPGSVPPPPQPRFENLAARPTLPPSTSSSADPAEQAYDQGYQLWMAKRYPEAITALRAMASSFPGHRRVSWANNLAGRALLDSGQPRPAAEALLANYRRDPQGERAPDSLFYLGQALVQLKQPGQACKAYDELRDVYGATMRADLRKMLPAARAKAGCK